MAKITDLPDELLLQIVSYLRNRIDVFLQKFPAFDIINHPPMEAELKRSLKDIRSVCLVCKRLQPVGQEALLRNVVILNNPGDGSRLPAVTQLIRTLLERPELRDLVKMLDINTYDFRPINMNYIFPKYTYMHDLGGALYCTVEAFSFLALIKAYIHDNPAVRTWFGEDWTINFLSGSINEQIGFLLTLAAELKRLNLCPYAEGDPFYAHNWLNGMIDRPSTKELFGELFFNPRRHFPEVVGFRKLEKIGCTPELAHYFVELPNPNTLWTCFPRYFDDLKYYTRTKEPQFSQVKTLSVYKNLREFEKSIYIDNSFMERMSQKLERLQVLELILSAHDTEWHSLIHIRGYSGPLEFDNILKSLPQCIEKLIINTSEFFGPRTRLDDSERDTAKRIWHDVLPASNMENLDQLKKIVAPQEFFFRVLDGPTLTVCRLPRSLEKIEIVDSTVDALLYLKHIVNHKSEYPNLRDITLSHCNNSRNLSERPEADDTDDNEFFDIEDDEFSDTEDDEFSNTEDDEFFNTEDDEFSDTDDHQSDDEAEDGELREEEINVAQGFANNFGEFSHLPIWAKLKGVQIRTHWMGDWKDHRQL